MQSSTRFLWFLSVIFLLAGCGQTYVVDGPPTEPLRVERLDPEDAVPRVEPRSKYGNPPSYVVFGKRYYTMTSSDGFVERGVASWYGKKFHGRRTSSGETYDMYAMTAAHKALPLPTYARVTHLGNGKSIVVRINDRGPFHRNRVIDLSYAAATRLDMVRAGTALVEVRAIDPRRTEVQARGPSDGPPASAGAPVRQAREISIYLQVGAFASLANAERFRASLAGVAEHTPAKIAEAQRGGQTLYRVRLGPLRDVNAADTLSNRLSSAGIDEAVVVLDEALSVPRSY